MSKKKKILSLSYFFRCMLQHTFENKMHWVLFIFISSNLILWIHLNMNTQFIIIFNIYLQKDCKQPCFIFCTNVIYVKVCSICICILLCCEHLLNCTYFFNWIVYIFYQWSLSCMLHIFFLSKIISIICFYSIKSSFILPDFKHHFK